MPPKPAVIDFNEYSSQEVRRTHRPASRQTTSIGDAIRAFQDAMEKAGLGVTEVIADGELHRFDAPDKERHNKNCWYLFYPDGIPSGAFGRWDHATSEKWCSRSKHELSHEELKAINARMKAAQERKKLARQQEADEAATSAAHILQNSPDATDEHPYLQRKQVKAFNLKVGRDGYLLVPLFNEHSQIRGLERIPAEPGKKKLLLKGVDPKGIFGFIDGEKDTVYVVEGYATGASVHMATGHAVAVARNAGNLEPVVGAIKRIFTQARVVIAGDNDQWTKRADGTPWNPGVEDARAAATCHGVQVVFPEFKSLDGMPTDFNDLWVREGAEEVRRQLMPTSFEIISFEDIMAMHFDDNPVIEGLLDERENLVLIGPGNIGKSLFTLNLALFLAAPRNTAQPQGVDFNQAPKLFGLFPVPRQRRVLFLQSENTAKATQKRLSFIMKGRPEAQQALSNIVLPRVGTNDCRIHGAINADFFDEARSIIRRSKAEVVIIDPLISFHDCDENDNVAMRSALDRFNDLANATNTSFVVVHHTGKDAEKGGRGASAIRDWYDNALIMNHAHSDEDRSVIRIIHDKSRNCKIVAPFFLERTKNLDYKPVEDPEVYLAVKAVVDAGGVVSSEAALIDGIEMLTPADRSRRHWQRAIKRAVMAKLIIRTGEGKGTKYRVEKTRCCN